MSKKYLVFLIPVLLLVIGFGCQKMGTLEHDYGFDVERITLLTPEDGSTITENPPTLTWEQPMGEDTYDVQVSLNESFDVCRVNATAQFELGTNASYTLPIELDAGTYCWRVRTSCYS
jgi:hypothetical protein